MNKKVKLTSGILAGALLFSNFSGLDITKATEPLTLNVQTQNNNLVAQLVKEDGKNYILVKALKDVQNIAIRANASNNQTFVFKHSELKQGESVKFELDLEEVKQEVPSQKVLPKTDIVREKLELRGVVKTFNVVATISYDVNVEKPAEVVETPKMEEPKMTEEVSNESKIEEKEVEETPKEPETPMVSEEVTNTSEVSMRAASLPVVTTRSASVENNVVAKPVVASYTEGNYNEQAAQEILVLVNQYRKSKGLKELTLNRNLDSGTVVRLNEFVQAVNSGKSGQDLHARPTGAKWFTAFSGLGKVVSENLATSKNGSVGLVNWWKSSSSHNAAMIDPKATNVSIKVVENNGRYYGIQIFGR